MFLHVKCRLLKDRLLEAIRYYRNGRFTIVDLSLSALYLFSNPYRMCRKFLQAKGLQNVYAYGETPLRTLETLAQAFDICPEDRWLELGSGRGRTCFWLSLVWGCSVRGVEWVPSFVSRASKLVKFFSLPDLAFQENSIENADFSWATVVFLYSTCMAEEEIEALLLPMSALPERAKVITVSAPLCNKNYRLIQSVPLDFPWGKTKAYLHLKTRLQTETVL